MEGDRIPWRKWIVEGLEIEGFGCRTPLMKVLCDCVVKERR